MAERTHCDCCNEVIRPTEDRLVVRPGRGRGATLHGTNDEDELDFCRKCIIKQPAACMVVIRTQAGLKGPA